MKRASVALVRAYVSNCYEANTPDFLVYHNLAHTEEVVAHCQTLAAYYKLEDEDEIALLTAAWFHDIGQLYTTSDKHEEKSNEVMRLFLSENFPLESLTSIEKIILATKVTKEPTSFLEKIIRDADTYHFGTKRFLTTDKLVKKEVELRTGVSIPDWKSHSLEMLKAHRFYTLYCQEHLANGKQENIDILEAELQASTIRSDSLNT